MKRDVDQYHPIRLYFTDAIHESLHARLGLDSDVDVEAYLTDMLVAFVHQDEVFSIRDKNGRQLKTVAEMMAEGDIRLNADSFEREREVHKHIGDFLLFWGGMFGQFLECDRQGKESYHIVSTFDFDPYSQEAPLFKKLSDEFEAYRLGLSLVRASFEGFARQGWTDGFQA